MTVQNLCLPLRRHNIFILMSFGVMQLGHKTCTVVTVVSIVAGWSGVVSSSFFLFFVPCVMTIAYVLACPCFVFVLQRLCNYRNGPMYFFELRALQAIESKKMYAKFGRNVCISTYVCLLCLCNLYIYRVHSVLCVFPLAV